LVATSQRRWWQTSSPARSVDADALDDGVGRGLAWTVFWAPAVGTVLLAATVPFRSVFLWLVAEDHPIEWAQFFGFALAAGLGVACSVLLARRGETVACVLLALFALGLIFIAGEEISWGQRLFHLATPGSLAAVNHQDEINLHDIDAGFSVQKLFNWFQLFAGALGAVVPWLTRVRPPVWSNRLARLVSPSLFLTPCFALLFAYRFVRLFLYSDASGRVAIKFGEWPELTFAVGLLGFALILYRSLRPKRRASR
jgi:hypothetical protein